MLSICLDEQVYLVTNHDLHYKRLWKGLEGQVRRFYQSYGSRHYTLPALQEQALYAICAIGAGTARYQRCRS